MLPPDFNLTTAVPLGPLTIATPIAETTRFGGID